MILVDFSQVIIAGLMVQLKMTDGEISEDMLRHMILNSLRSYQKKYGNEYGDMVLCTDAANPWRRDYFPLYKANRKKSRDKDDKDWGLIFDTLHKVKEEIRDNFPYRFMYVENCEADDIIAILTQHAYIIAPNEKVLIISGDKDFQQLQRYDQVSQFSPNVNKFIEPEGGAEEFLKEHILKGDKADGIPNILSNDNCLDEGIRQTPLRRSNLEKYLRITISSDDKYYRNYLRNQTLIDFDFIPQEVIDRILNECENTAPVKGKVFDYLRTHRLNELLNHVEDFAI